MRFSLVLQWKALSVLVVSLAFVAHSQPIGDSNGRASYGTQTQASHKVDSSHRKPLIKRSNRYPNYWLPSEHHSWPYGDSSYVPQQAPGFASASHHPSDAQLDQHILDTLYEDLARKGRRYSPPASPNQYGHYGAVLQQPSSQTLSQMTTRFGRAGLNEPVHVANQRASFGYHPYGAPMQFSDAQVPIPATDLASAEGVSNREATRRGKQKAVSGASSAGKVSRSSDENKRTRKAVSAKWEPEALQHLKYTPYPLKRDSDPRTKFIRPDNKAVFDEINSREFAGKLKWVDFNKLNPHTRDNVLRSVYRPSRALPFVRIPEDERGRNGGVINEVRMTMHGEVTDIDPDLRAKFVGKNLIGKKFYNFWGIPVGQTPNKRTEVVHYGMGYVEPEDFGAVDQHHQLRLAAANVASHLHV